MELDRRQDLALLLAAQAISIADTPEARSALFVSLEQAPQLTAFLDRSNRAVESVAGSPDGRLVAWSDDGGRIVLWDARDRRRIGRPLFAQQSGVASVAFSADGRQVAAGGKDGTVELWDVGTGQRIAVLDDRLDEVVSVAFSPDGRFLVAGGWPRDDDSSYLMVWDARTRQRLPKQPQLVHSVQAVTFSPQSDVLAAAAGSVQRWTTDTWEPLGELHADGEAATVAFSPDGRLLAASGNAGGYTLRVWDSHTDELVGKPLEGHKDLVEALAFSPGSGLSASGGRQDQLIVWDLASSRAVQTLNGHGADVLAVTFGTGDGELVSASADGAVALWELGRPSRLGTTLGEHGNWVETLGFRSRTGQLVAGSTNGTVMIWDTSGGRAPDVVVTGSAPFGNYAAVSDDGETLATADFSGRIVVWSTARKERLAELQAAEPPDRGGLIAEDTDVASWVRRACDVAGRNLAALEWALFLSGRRYERTCPSLPTGTPAAAGTVSALPN